MVVGNTQNDFGGRVWRGLEAADERPDMTVEQMESESGLSVSTVKRLRAGQDASVEQIVAISVALHLPPPVSGDLLRMCGITLDFNNQKNTVYQMILTEYYKEGIEQVNVCLEACGCAKLKTAC